VLAQPEVSADLVMYHNFYRFVANDYNTFCSDFYEDLKKNMGIYLNLCCNQHIIHAKNEKITDFSHNCYLMGQL